MESPTKTPYFCVTCTKSTVDKLCPAGDVQDLVRTFCVLFVHKKVTLDLTLVLLNPGTVYPL